MEEQKLLSALQVIYCLSHSQIQLARSLLEPVGASCSHRSSSTAQSKLVNKKSKLTLYAYYLLLRVTYTMQVYVVAKATNDVPI